MTIWKRFRLNQEVRLFDASWGDKWHGSITLMGFGGLLSMNDLYITFQTKYGVGYYY